MRKILIQPSNLPITLETAKNFLRVEDDYDNDLITSLIKGATQTAQAFTGLQLTSGTFLEALVRFDYQIKLLSPVTSITSVKYYDENNTLQTIDSANYRLNTFGKQHYLEFDNTYSFPSTYNRTDAILIEFVAGSTNIDSDIEAWIKIRVATLYENREEYSSGYGNLSKIDERFLNQMLYPHRIY